MQSILPETNANFPFTGQSRETGPLWGQQAGATPTAGPEISLPSMDGKNTRNIVLGLAILSVSIGLFFLWKDRVFDNFTTDRIEMFLSRFGKFGPLVYILLLAVAVVISQIPNVPLAIAAGMLFGTFRGGLYTLAGGMLGAVACFYIARSIGVTAIRKIFGKIPCFSDRCKEKHLMLLIFLSRLIPFFSFDLISYCAGLTNIRAKTFIVATFLGMVPMTFLFTHLGGAMMLHSYVSLLINGGILIVFLIAPMILRKYKLFGLNEYITFE
jgi:uncharacterized membrane protein YdjX (TVP38/TMEM64 family)